MEVKFNPVIKELWDDYREIVKVHGYGKESKQIAVKIYNLTRKE